MKENINDYLEVKSTLLKDENIEKVVFNTARETISITPRQDLTYNWIGDPLNNFRANDSIKICNKTFKVVNYLQNMNKIYELTLKEY